MSALIRTREELLSLVQLWREVDHGEELGPLRSAASRRWVY